MRPLLTAIFFVVAPLTAPAAVVSFLNASATDLQFTIEHKDTPDLTVKLPAGHTTAVRVGREPVLRVTLNGKAAAFTLEPYTPYLFVDGEKGGVTFSGVELAGELPKADDVPAKPAEWKGVKIPVTLFTDTSNPLTKEAREKAVKERFAAAAKVIEAQAGVTFDIAGVGEWEVDKNAENLAAAAAEFERKAEVKTGRAFGFLTRTVKGEEFAAPPSGTHALVRDGSPKADAERVEVIAQQLGHWLGAVRSPDGGSVMRAKLGDGNAIRKGWVTQFDPLNLIVMHVWAEELAAGRGPKPDDLSAKARARLRVLYKSVAAIHDAVKSDDTQARDMALAFAGDIDPKPNPLPKPADPVVIEPNRTDDEKAVRAVVQAVTKRAKELAADEKARPKGDALTAEYVQAAATATAALDEKRQAHAFLLGIGIALDDSTILRDKPVIGKLCQAVESDDDRTARLAVLGRPSLRGRRDLCQHYAVSAALAEMFGAAAAELAGLAKEATDMKGTSGFSFCDLAADLAGIELAAVVTKEPKRLADLAKKFSPDDAVPDVTKFDEGITEAAFKKKYGSTDDGKFKAAMDEVRSAVQGMPLYKK